MLEAVVTDQTWFLSLQLFLEVIDVEEQLAVKVPDIQEHLEQKLMS